MGWKDQFSPDWTWWIRAGQRLALGLDVRIVLEPTGKNLPVVLRRGLSRTLAGVDEGRGIVASLRDAGLKLPLEAWSLLEAGEQSGSLGESMTATGEFLREREERRKAFAGQLWYPAMVITTGILVMGIILLWVVPQMRDLSGSMGFGKELPWLTEHIGVLYSAVFMVAVAGFAGCSATILGLREMARRQHRWARIAEGAINRIPFYGWLRRCRREERICRQLGTLMRAGITLPRALSMAAKDAPEHWEAEQLLEFRTRLLMGSGFSDALSAFPLLREENHPLLQSGQENGQLDTYLLQVANDLGRQSRQQFKFWLRFLEPAVLLFLSVAIGGLVLAYLLPVVTMLERLA